MDPTATPSGLPASSNSSSSSTVLQLRNKFYGMNAALSYKQPLHIVRGQGCYLYDEEGAEYLDCVNNVAAVGHANLQVAAAVSSQLGCLYTNSRYLSSDLTSYCQELTATLPDPLQVVYLVNSGSEANDLALRIASAAAAAPPQSYSSSSSSKPHDHVVVMAGAYHGHLTNLIPLSSYKFWGKGGEGQQDWVHVMPCPDPYRGTNLDGTAAARAVLAEAAAAGGRVVAFFCESIISCGGQIVLPPGYLAAVYEVMRAAGVVCIADEVQTGFARSGDVFWAFQTQGVVPDIVTMGKPMGNGFPIGGLVTNSRLAAAFAAGGMEYFNTYGGNNAAVAAGRAVLQEIRQQQLQQKAAETGRYLQASLRSLQSRFPQLIGDIRGIGLFVGLDIVTCPIAKTPGPMFAAAIKEAAKGRRVLLSTDGPADNVIKIKPPLVFGPAEVDRLTAVLAEVLRELSAPEKFAQLQAQEQQHWQQHLAPLLTRYTQNEARLQQLMMAQAKQQQQQQQQQVGLQDMLSGVSERLAVRGTGSSSSSSINSSSSSRIDGVMMDLVPAAAAARMDSAAGVTATADAIRGGQYAEQPAMHAASKL